MNNCLGSLGRFLAVLPSRLANSHVIFLQPVTVVLFTTQWLLGGTRCYLSPRNTLLMKDAYMFTSLYPPQPHDVVCAKY